jgi:predicted transcriptional regulator
VGLTQTLCETGAWRQNSKPDASTSRQPGYDPFHGPACQRLRGHRRAARQEVQDLRGILGECALFPDKSPAWTNPDANRPDLCYSPLGRRCRMADTETKSIFDIEPDEAAEQAADAAAEAEIDAGRFVPHAEVAKWLRSWGTPNKLPRPRPKA